MASPQRVWRLSIFLAFLLLREISSTDTSTEASQAYNKQPYEVIDVANQRDESGPQVNTGQTTRILTTGDVDDSFWLKYLGEDFRHAVHLQVGGNDRYDGATNEAYRRQHKTKPVEEQNNEKTEAEDVDKDEGKNDRYVSRSSNEIVNNSNFTTTAEDKNDTQGASIGKERHRNRFEYNRGAGENGSASHNHYYKYAFGARKLENNHHMSNAKAHLNHKHMPTYTYTHRNIKRDNEREIERNRGSSSVVVDLPHFHKHVHHHDDAYEPVVVKMPPIIYHSNSNYPTYKDLNDGPNETAINPNSHFNTDRDTNTDTETDNQLHTHTHTDTHRHGHKHMHLHTNLPQEEHQYSDSHLRPHVHEHAHTHADTHTHTQIDYTKQSQYPAQYRLPTVYPQPPFEDNSFSAVNEYRAQNQIFNAQTEDETDSTLNYIVENPTTAPTNYDSTMEFNRVGRSNKETPEEEPENTEK